jgi:hypothetical protein
MYTGLWEKMGKHWQRVQPARKPWECVFREGCGSRERTQMSHAVFG